MPKPEILAIKRPNPPQPPNPPVEPEPAAAQTQPVEPTKPNKPIKQPAITSVTNSQGEVFEVGNTIKLIGGQIAEISGFYKGAEREIYAKYEVTNDPDIKRGISRVEVLQRPDS